MGKIRMSKYFMLVIGAVLSITYISASSNIVNNEVTQLYKLISLSHITYEKVIVGIKGVTESEKAPVKS